MILVKFYFPKEIKINMRKSKVSFVAILVFLSLVLGTTEMVTADSKKEKVIILFKDHEYIDEAKHINGKIIREFKDISAVTMEVPK